MKENEILREQIFEIVSDQLKNNDPPETTSTYNRLIEDGFDDNEVRQMIGSCVIVEIYDVIQSGKPYDNERFINNLNKLPENPF
ncbi:MAG: hypothetical protein RQ761_05595 [Bacteroidales bacterium]|nr:hypothetical protein [Bacteroidales bacterium]